MEMDYMDPFHPRYPVPTMQSFGAHQDSLQPAPQYPYLEPMNPLMAYYQHQQPAALMGHGAMQLSRPTEPRPRLSREEVDLLEAEFAKNPKPSSSTKRELAERMNVEVPRINNWFQNRRAKEKQMKKTAEFEAQQARERAASESKPCEEQQGLATAPFGDDHDNTESVDATPECSPAEPASASDSPASSDSDGFVHVTCELTGSPPCETQGMTDLVACSFSGSQNQAEFQQPTTLAFRPADEAVVDHLPGPSFDPLPALNGIGMSDAAAFSSFPDQDYFAIPSVSHFPPMVNSSAPSDFDNQLLKHHSSGESLAESTAVSPLSAPDSPPTVSNLRFKSPPPPADIAGRRKMRRPAPLGLSSLRGGPGPKTGIEPPRRADATSPRMRRISSATGLSGRVQKIFMGPGVPRSPFAMDRNKEALLQSFQSSQNPVRAASTRGISPVSPEGMACQGDEQGYAFGSLGQPLNGIPLFNAEPAVKSPPGTPGLPMGFPETSYFPTSLDHSWSYVRPDEPLPTPSLCSHGGSELEFSMAPRLPGYVASQPVTPSFPPTMGPTYTGYFGTSLGPTEYHFPESYPAESSTRSSPAAPPRSKQFQFAQNVTPQDFNTDKS